jgi:hypothetical protein
MAAKFESKDYEYPVTAWTLVNTLFLRELPNPIFCRSLLAINIYFILQPIFAGKKPFNLHKATAPVLSTQVKFH